MDTLTELSLNSVRTSSEILSNENLQNISKKVCCVGIGGAAMVMLSARTWVQVPPVTGRVISPVIRFLYSPVEPQC